MSHVSYVLKRNSPNTGSATAIENKGLNSSNKTINKTNSQLLPVIGSVFLQNNI